MPVGVSAYVALANVTLGSSASSVTFSSISGSYRDLVLVLFTKHTANSNYTRIRINSDSGSNYSHVTMRGTGSATGSSLSTETYIYPMLAVTESSSDFMVGRLDFMDYSATDKHKTVLIRADVSVLATNAEAVRWASTSAITSLVIDSSASLFVAGTTMALYGVSA